MNNMSPFDSSSSQSKQQQPLYQPLQAREFRLLQIQHGSPRGSLHAKFHGKLSHLFSGSQTSATPPTSPSSPSTSTISACIIVAHLDKPPKYKALSYTWGFDAPVHRITLNGEEFLVRQNLYDFLVQTIKNPSLVDRPIFIDAICINQDDNAEKGVQVNQMGDVYRNAKDVVVWLGDAADHSHQAFKLLRVLEKLYSSLPATFVKARQALNANQETNNTADWTALGKLLCRPWFSRMWIVQEVVLARKAVALCGEETIPFAMIQRFANEFNERDLGEYILASLDKVEESRMARKHGMCLVGIEYMRNEVRDKKVELSSTLGILDSFTSTDGRDMIYGILGMVPKMERYGFRADYTIDVKETYVSATGSIMKTEKSLKLLSKAGVAQERVIEGLPSWVPDYIHSMVLPQYHGALDGKGSFSLQINGSELHLRGYLISTIVEMGPVLENDGVRYDHQGMYHWFVKTSSQFSASILEHYDAFWRTLCGDLELSHATNLYQRAQNLTEQHFEDYKKIAAKRYGSGKSTDEFGTEEMNTFFEFELLMNEACTPNKKVYLTKDGRFGIVPGKARKGDTVAVVLGGTEALVLRPLGVKDASKAKYQLVAACYCHGVMWGEARGMGLEEKAFVLM